MSEELKNIAFKLAKDGPVKVMPTPRLIQLLHNGIFFIRTTAAVYVWEHAYYPQLYIPRTVLDEAANSNPNLSITEGEKITYEGNEIATFLSLKIGQEAEPITKILSFSSTPPNTTKDLSGLVKIDFKSVDRWFEESSPIFVHPKDPFKRIEILPSTRHIKVSLQGTTLAETTTSSHLYETGLPPRYYLPFPSLTHPEILIPSTTKTECPYKGVASYYSVDLAKLPEGPLSGNGKGGIYEDIIWYYDVPTPESAGIMGLICFYNEKVDVEIDGVLQEPVMTHFAKGPNSKPPLF